MRVLNLVNFDPDFHVIFFQAATVTEKLGDYLIQVGF